MRDLFLEQKIHQFLSNFSKYKFFRFFAKFQFWWKKEKFQKYNHLTFDTAATANLPLFPRCYKKLKFFLKKNFFSKNPKYLTNGTTTLSAFYGKFF